MEENKNNVPPEQNQNPDGNKSSKEIKRPDAEKTTNKSSEQNSLESSQKKENLIFLSNQFTDNLNHLNSENLSKYLTSDFNSYIYPKLFDIDLALNNSFLFKDSTLDNQLKLAEEINVL